MKIAFIGDIVGRPAREIIRDNLLSLKDEYSIDYIIANYENASHGFGLTQKNMEELLSSGIDMMSGGNHSFDKKDIFPLFEKYPLIRPINYPKSAPGKGIYTTTINNHKVAIINLMGYHFMGAVVDNPFNIINDEVAKLQKDGVKHIIIDIHAETTAEKRTLLYMLKDKVSAIMGTHTHVGTDDLEIVDGCCYVTDVGLTGCIDNVLGMSIDVPIAKMTTGVGKHFDVPNECKSILQMIIFELDDNGRAISSMKLKIFDDGKTILTNGLNFNSRKKEYN